MAYAVIRTARPEIIRDVMDYPRPSATPRGAWWPRPRPLSPSIWAPCPTPCRCHERVRRRSASRRRRGDERPLRGGMHIPDVFLLPADSWTGRWRPPRSSSGTTDMGGRVSGSNASDSTEIYQEGLRIPPVKPLRARRAQPDDAAHHREERAGAGARAGRPGRAVRGVQGVGARARQAFARYGRQTTRATSPSCSTMPSASRAPRSRWPRAPTASPTTSIATASATTRSCSRWPSPCTTTAIHL
jgi:N-methylhydantoinase B